MTLTFKGVLCRIQGDLLAGMEYRIHEYVVISVESPVTTDHCAIVSLE